MKQKINANYQMHFDRLESVRQCYQNIPLSFPILSLLQYKENYFRHVELLNGTDNVWQILGEVKIH